MASARRAFSSTAAACARPKRSLSPRSNPLDMANMLGQPFDFPLTRDTILKMEKKREFLHYLRSEQLQFKDLVAFRQRFEPPSKRQMIRLRRQHYQGEQHPASRKVDITVSVADLPLSSDNARHKFKLIAGPRWNSLTDEVKIACEQFPTDKMNEKWCSDTLDKMLAEAENKSDDMSDIPLDTRPTIAKMLKKRAKLQPVTLKHYPREWLPQNVNFGNKTRSDAQAAAAELPASEGSTAESIQDLPSAGVGKQGGAEKL
ncbi:37S ribosomal protein S24, mitochondrial [Microbotryomycetes sp. JL201]|nr:37S ribosomal protein S24, mitochondrial [Microbotryomycetes sp. JL201]